MPDSVTILGIAMVISLNFYVLMGGADYGGGVWDLLASGPRKKEQQKLIEEAIGPIWEANHVWLILAVVVLFAAFPRAYAAISTSLHIPLTMLLLGIVARGTAFTFRSHDKTRGEVQRRCGRIFAISSLITPILLGIIVGTISYGGFVMAGSSFNSVYVEPWLNPFPLCVGVFALTLFSFLAAVYLANYATTDALKRDFRVRALVAQCASAILAVVVFVMAESSSPPLRDALEGSVWSIPILGSTALVAGGCTLCVVVGRLKLARALAAIQVSLILWGWALSQFPYLVRPDLTLFNCRGPEATLQLLIAALFAGGLILFPSFYALYRIFHLRER